MSKSIRAQKELNRRKLLFSSSSTNFGKEIQELKNQSVFGYDTFGKTKTESVATHELEASNEGHDSDESHDSDEENVAHLQASDESEVPSSDDEEDSHPAKKRKAAWADDDDDKEIIERHSRRGILKVTGDVYKEILDERYATTHGDTPDWANLDHPKRDDEDEYDEDAIVIRGSLYQTDVQLLPANTLKYSFVSDITKKGKELNKGRSNYRTIFAQTKNIAVCTRISKNKTGFASLYQIGTDECPPLASECLAFERFPISASCFMADGNSFLVGARHVKHMFHYDLLAMKECKIPWVELNEAREMKSMKLVSDTLVAINESHQVTLLDTRSGRPVGRMMSSSNISDFAVTSDGSTIYTQCRDGPQVHIWDVRSSQAQAYFNDNGCITGTVIDVSPDNRMLACGSDSGIINVYNTRDIGNSSNPKAEFIKPFRVLDQLTTKVTSMHFNHSSEALAFSSVELRGSVKMAHFPSGDVFSNFPTIADSVQHVHQVLFTPHSGYLAISTGKGDGARVMRARLHHFHKY